MVEVKIDDLLVESRNDSEPAVILKEKTGDSKRKLLIQIGETEALAIKSGLAKTEHPRPRTHDLFKSIIDTLSTKVVAIYINAVEKPTFYAKMKLKSESQEFDIDSRPSDALAIAIRYNAPIYVEEDVIEKNGFFEKEK